MTPFDPRLPIIAAEARVKTCHVFHCWQALRDMGKHFHVAAFASFAGLEEKHVLAILAALREHDAMPAGRTTSTRGMRLPNDWTAPDEWIDWAVRRRQWHPDDARQEAETFANFWQAKSGPGAAKLDWKKTWQNWVTNSRRQNGDYYPSDGPVLSHAEHMERTAALYDRMGRTNEADEIRRDLARKSNVVPFNREEPAKKAM